MIGYYIIYDLPCQCRAEQTGNIFRRNTIHAKRTAQRQNACKICHARKICTILLKQLHFFLRCSIIYKHLGVAQFGSALDWGSRCRWFKSSHSDQKKELLCCNSFFFVLFYCFVYFVLFYLRDCRRCDVIFFFHRGKQFIRAFFKRSSAKQFGKFRRMRLQAI